MTHTIDDLHRAMQPEIKSLARTYYKASFDMDELQSECWLKIHDIVASGRIDTSRARSSILHFVRVSLRRHIARMAIAAYSCGTCSWRLYHARAQPDRRRDGELVHPVDQLTSQAPLDAEDYAMLSEAVDDIVQDTGDAGIRRMRIDAGVDPASMYTRKERKRDLWAMSSRRPDYKPESMP